MKRIISFILVFVVVLSFSTMIFADYQLYDITSATEFSRLDISGTTATCTSTASIASTDISTIKITQTLEKQGFLWIWGRYAGDWTKTLTKSGNLSTKVYNLPSGNYRVKSVFVITLKDGTSQTITLYSAEKTVS